MLGITVWPFQPNMAAGPVREEYGYLSDVITSYDRTEQRIALRRHPTGAIEYDVLLDDLWEAERANVLLHRKQAKLWAAPLWPYRRRLEVAVAAGDATIGVTTAPLPWTDAQDLGPYALLWRSAQSFELVKLNAIYPSYLELVDAAAAAWPASTTWVIPIRLARLEKQVQGEWLNGRAFAARVRFTFDAYGIDNVVPTFTDDLIDLGDDLEPAAAEG